MNKIPESQIGRAGVAGVAAARVGFGQLQHTAKRPFLSKEKQDSQRIDLEDRNAQLVFKALTQLRGTAVKLAQMLGMESDLLPEAYQRELRKSWHQVPPLNRVLVRKVFHEEFGKSPESLYQQFDDVAFAAASLGQVHAAQLEDGTDVVVKVQYPGIATTMDSDIALLKKLLVGLPNRKVIQDSIGEIHSRMTEETDYLLEQEQTRFFARELTLDNVEVPTVYSDFSTARVLTTKRLDGRHLDEWLASDPDQSARDRAAQTIYDVFAHSSMNLRRLHADPNPGNYLFREDGSIGLIDFGCTKQLSDNFVQHFPGLLRAYAAEDKTAIVDAYADLGMRLNELENDTWEEILKPFGAWLTEPFATDAFDFKKNSDYTNKAKDLLHRMMGLSNIDTIADDFIFFDRTVYGLCKLFERLGATVRLRHHWFEEKRS